MLGITNAYSEQSFQMVSQYVRNRKKQKLLKGNKNARQR